MLEDKVRNHNYHFPNLIFFSQSFNLSGAEGMSEQHIPLTLSKHNPACLRIALSIYSFAEPDVCGSAQWPPGEQEGGWGAHLGAPGGEGAARCEPRSVVSASSPAEQKGWGFCAA